MKLFKKLKDYNSLLEEILDQKTFSSISKSLLFSMIYKLEVSYRDYSTVKVDSLEKDIFFNNILNVIKKYCDNIKTVEPDSRQASLLVIHNVEAVTNEKERSILVYPTEQAMLYAISDIEPKYFFIKDGFLFKDILQNVLVQGYKQNTMEVLRNFNGWSWDISIDDKNWIQNLIYQNLIIIKGEEFLYRWRTDSVGQKDYLGELKRSIKKITGNDNYYLSLCKLLYLIADDKQKNIIRKKIEGKNFKFYIDILNNSKSIYDVVIELQKYFLNFMECKVQSANEKENILEIIYEFRYYQNVCINNVLIKKNKNLKSSLDFVQRLLITKACKMGVLKIISMNIDFNFEILKFILDTKILNLEGIRIEIDCQQDEIFLKVYDKKIFEKQGKQKFIGNQKDIVIRKNRLLKLFN